MAVSLGDALGISEVKLPRQLLNSESGDCAKMCPCIGHTACLKQ